MEERVLPCARSRPLSFWVWLSMGGQFSYVRCPQSPTEMPKESSSPNWKPWVVAAGVFAVTLGLMFTFLGLYLKQRAECESPLRNNTSPAEGRMAESDALRAQLAAVNQSLANTREHWASCQEELKHSRGNTTALEDDIRKKEETLKRLNGEKTRLQNQLADLKKSQETWKQERDEKDKRIQRLEEQLSERQASSSGVALVAYLLLLIVPGVLCSLL